MPRRFPRVLLCFTGMVLLSAAALAAPDAKAVKKPAKSAAQRKAVLPRPALKLHDEGALGYDWAEWRNVGKSGKDVRLRWRLGVVANGAASGTFAGTAVDTDASVSGLFEEEKSRTQVMVTDTPLHRDGVLTIGVRIEF